MEKFNNKKWMYWFTLAVSIIVVYNIFDNIEAVTNFISNLLEVLAPFFTGILIAYLLYIPCKSLESALFKSKLKVIKKRSRSISITIIYLLILGVVILALNLIFPIIFESISDLAANFENYYKETIDRYEEIPEDSILKHEEIDKILEDIKNIDIFKYINMDSVVQYAKSALDAILGIFDVFIAIIVSIFLLAQRTRIIQSFKKILSAIFEEKVYNNINKIFNNSNSVFFRFLAGQFLDAIVVSILTTIVMSVMGVKYAPLLGFLIGLFNMIPYVGAIIAVIISFIITIFTGGLSQAIWMIIVVTIIQQIDANIINPKIIGNSLKISPLVVIFAITIGGAYFGILGMFLSVPICAVILIVIDDYVKFKIEERKEQKEQEKIDNNYI